MIYMNMSSLSNLKHIYQTLQNSFFKFRTEVYIGLSDGIGESVMRHTNGKVTNFLPYALGQPNGGMEQNCMAIDSSSKYQDKVCHEWPARPICQKVENSK